MVMDKRIHTFINRGIGKTLRNQTNIENITEILNIGKEMLTHH